MTRIDEIKERLRKVSAYPWLYTNDADAAGENWLVGFGRSGIDNKEQYVITTDNVPCSELGDAKNDAEFVANAPADIAYLLALVEEAKVFLAPLMED